jgi:antitoxin component of RelBE/YafQ-DinJ toxin-antitoxin module
MGAEESQRQLSKYYIEKKEIEDSWDVFRKDIRKTKEIIEDKVSKEVDDYLTKKVLPYDKISGGKEIEKLKKKMTTHIVKKITLPLDESLKKSDESYIKFIKDRSETDTHHKRALTSVEEPLSKREIEKAHEIIEEMEKKNE